MKCLCILLVVTVLCENGLAKDSGPHFQYDGDGPDHWKDSFKQCIGKRQSPINIDMHEVVPAKFPDIKIQNVEHEYNARILNNGHTVQMELTGDNLPTITGGPLRNRYRFRQLHFHWGENDTIGSENRIDNATFPMELHMVFYNTLYNSSDEAAHESGGLTVLSFLYQLSKEDNPDYIDFVEALQQIKSVDSSTVINHTESLLDLIRPCANMGMHSYFTYEGSLTTPPCSEVVIWIEFRDPVFLSHSQIAAFRQLSSHFGTLTHNWRPVQPINDRNVYLNTALENSIERNSAARLGLTLGLGVLNVLIVLFFKLVF